MQQKELEFYNECIDLISTYVFIKDMTEILNKIMSLINSLSQDNLHQTERLTKEILCSFDFEREGIIIKYKNKRHVSALTRIKGDCIYIIGRLILLAFKKIAEHELEKQINLSDELSIIYKTLKLAIEQKKSQR